MAENQPNENGERGVIINTSSILAHRGLENKVAYAASKAGIVGMTLPLAKELSAYGIRVVDIAPGIFSSTTYNELQTSSNGQTSTPGPIFHKCTIELSEVDPPLFVRRDVEACEPYAKTMTPSTVRPCQPIRIKINGDGRPDERNETERELGGGGGVERRQEKKKQPNNNKNGVILTSNATMQSKS
ncbi:hypothetical protein GWI33_012301 [Rhynchophorus ferrugineus]|uniref:Uncharacterized protein n=1 Tax=Rhynchophorus ferrugineus TaxID=354439 RepID=A0A834I5L4_RHYFE|nr:hypothetical protein GWI33_012301 [Rhynchophorus ferrugineus]